MSRCRCIALFAVFTRGGHLEPLRLQKLIERAALVVAELRDMKMLPSLERAPEAIVAVRPTQKLRTA
jgi:hypothetical protein